MVRRIPLTIKASPTTVIRLTMSKRSFFADFLCFFIPFSLSHYTFTVSGMELTAVPKGSPYYVEVPNISASQLANMFTLTVTHPNGDATETLSVTYGP